MPCTPPKFNRSRSRNTSLGLKHIGTKARLKLSHTKETAEPQIIIQSKAILKSTKRTTLAIKHCAESLYNAQSEKHRIEQLLSNQLSNIKIQNNTDRFGIFCNNMGRVQSNMHEIYEMYLMQIQHLLINPLHDFNMNEIAKCQQNKIKLKTMKAEHDMIYTKERKIKEMLDQRFPSDPSSNFNQTKGRHLRSKSAMKLDELQAVRNEFLKSFMFMDAKKLHILQSIKNYMSSFEVYASMHSDDIQSNYALMHNLEILNEPNARFWSKHAVILKEGYFEKQEVGKKKVFRKQYFKLFVSKKLIFLDECNGIQRGYIDLNKIFDIGIKDLNLIRIETMDINSVSVVYTFRFDSSECRDSWLNVLEKAISSKTVSMKQTAKMYKEGYNRLNQHVSG